MKQQIKILTLTLLTVSFVGTSCFKDLDTVPLDPNVDTAEVVYENPEAYKQVLAKLYSGLAVTGQQGPSGNSDIAGIDEGFGQYLRGLWYHQEFPTEEAVVGWNDQTIKDFHEQDWDENDTFIAAFYYRIFYQVAVCNEFLRQTTDAKLNSRGVEDPLYTEIQGFRAEARFLRALSYWHALDHFRNVPFITEEDEVGAFFPPQTNANDLFNYIESELLAIEGQLPAPRGNQYGRADQGAAWMLLAKLYLNAEVYINKAAYSECLEYVNKIIGGGYSLEPEYKHLFDAEDGSNEIIFPIRFDGVSTKTWGGTTFIIRAGIGGSMNEVAIDQFGVIDGWGGTRATSALVNKFPAVASDEGGGFVVLPNAGNEEYPELYVPGSFVGWNPANAPAITNPLDDGIYEGYIYFKDDNTQFKITEERSFANNYGDDNADGTLDFNGDNIVVAEAGLYHLSVDFINLTYTLSKTDWGIIGSATPNGWDSDMDMTYDPDNESLVIEAFLNAGEIKFRANDDWAINFGDDGADAILEQDGANITIDANGNYRIRLYLDKPDYTYSIELTSTDNRATFWTEGQNLEIADIALFTEGYAVTKFNNKMPDGSNGKDLGHPDTDFPVFRLADAYLMYAEAVLRGGGGDMGTAVGYINAIRQRAYGDPAGDIEESDLTLDFILDERARELFWEAHRRTDLVRFGQFTDGSYMWPWKGGVPEGRTVSSHRDVYPIPQIDIGANPNLRQNEGY